MLAIRVVVGIYLGNNMDIQYAQSMVIYTLRFFIQQTVY